MKEKSQVLTNAAGRSLGRRLVLLNLGLALYGAGLALMIAADVGLAPWDAFHVGLTHVVPGLSVGMASIGVGLVFLVGAALFLDIRPGCRFVAQYGADRRVY
jgi:uncharacterized membrane protein YczE